MKELKVQDVRTLGAAVARHVATHNMDKQDRILTLTLYHNIIEYGTAHINEKRFH